MPINRVPVVHKFGIISQSQRVELEERITKKVLSEAQREFVSQQKSTRYDKLARFFSFFRTYSPRNKCIFTVN